MVSRRKVKGTSADLFCSAGSLELPPPFEKEGPTNVDYHFLLSSGQVYCKFRSSTLRVLWPVDMWRKGMVGSNCLPCFSDWSVVEQTSIATHLHLPRAKRDDTYDGSMCAMNTVSMFELKGLFPSGLESIVIFRSSSLHHNTMTQEEKGVQDT